MPNKFQKSVLERLEQEASRQKKAVPEKETVGLVKEDKKPTKQKNLKKQGTIDPLPPSVAAEPSQTVFTQVFQPTDIGDYLRRDTQRIAKNKTFYLDTDVIEMVKSTAYNQGVTDSKLVNDILRRVFGL